MDYNDTENMKSHLLVNLFKQSVKTFTPKSVNDVEFLLNLKTIKNMMNRVRADHVMLDPSFNNHAVWESKEKAPCTYIEIFQNQNFNMSIFILKPGFTMPLHDHPHMYGFLKVISGTARIKCFSKLKPDLINSDLLLQTENQNCDISISNTFLAEYSQYRESNAESECCFLTPEDSNFHEIEAINGPSAFIDILAPPYSNHLRDASQRICHYYKVTDKVKDNIVKLQEIPTPNWFYCDQSPYLGPVLI